MSVALLTARTAPIPLALALLMGLYVLPEGERAVWAPLFGVGLLLCSELAYWSLESGVAQRVYGDVVTPRLVAVAGVAGASLPAAALVMLAAEADVGRSPAVTAVAALALAGCAGLLFALVTARASGRSP